MRSVAMNQQMTKHLSEETDHSHVLGTVCFIHMGIRVRSTVNM